MVLKIGTVFIEDPVILAPMSGITDLPFRDLVKSFGAGLVVSEMVASTAVIEANKRTKKRLEFRKSGSPISIQLMGRDPGTMAEAAMLCQDLGADIIDINFGCPAKKVVSGAAGSALMREEPLARKIMHAVVKAVGIPVTIKMRTGWDINKRNAPELARIGEDIGIQLVTVHGRTRCQFYDGASDWKFIGAIKNAIKIPVIGNGDITQVEDAKTLQQTAHTDGVMIGRGAQGRPWFLAHVIHFLKTGERLARPSSTFQLNIALRHFDSMLSYYGVKRGIRIARKHLNWYTAGCYSYDMYKDQLLKSDDPKKIRTSLNELFHLDLDVPRSNTAFV